MRFEHEEGAGRDTPLRRFNSSSTSSRGGHCHLAVADRNGRLPAFMQYLDSLVARAVNASLGRFEGFWATDGSYSAVEPLDPADVVAKTAYVLANPVAAGLVRRGAEWPGLWSSPEQIGAGTLVARRPKVFFGPRSYLPETTALELTAPPFNGAGRGRSQNTGGVLLPRPSSAFRAAGVLRPWPAVLVTWGEGGATRLHAHHCWHLIVGLDADLAVTTRAGGRSRRAGALITAPDAPHAVDARGTRALIVFVEPESDAGERLLAARGRASISLYPDADAKRLRAMLSPEGSALAHPEDVVARALSLAGEPVDPPPGGHGHPGVRRVLRYLRQAGPETDTSLAALAEIARLSPGRFMHAFTETVRIPLRPYLRWLKLERAGAALAGGASLGEAAYGAGFADAAHMSRTFVRMFGVSPSDVRRRSQSVQDG